MEKKIFTASACGYYTAIICSLLLVLVVSMWRVPAALLWLWPLWPVLWLLMWNQYGKYRLHVGMIWFAGVAMDLLTGSLLGLHVLLYLLIYYGSLSSRWNMHRVMIIPKPALVFLLILFYVFVEQLVLNGWVGSFYGLQYLTRCLVTFIIWMLVSVPQSRGVCSSQLKILD